MYIKKTLDNGIRVFAEKIPYAESLSIGVWVGNGSRHEKAEESGISHFIEHMVFKGTRSRTATQIALEMDSVGGHLNAFTTKEATCFYAKTLKDYAYKAMDILSDMVFEPSITQEDMDLERKVIFEEIAMYEDSPEDVAYDLFSEGVWGDTPMGRPILGTPDTLNEVTPDKMRQYISEHYRSGNIVIALAGMFDDTIFDELNKFFGNRKIKDGNISREPAVYRPTRKCLTKDFEQTQLIAGFRGIDTYDERVYPLLVFNNVFGSGMSSRLFQNIREKYGLVYSVGAGHSAYSDGGTFDILAATSAENVSRVSELICDEIRAIKKWDITDDELERAKVQLKGNYILSTENIGSRMQALGRDALLDRPLRTRQEITDKIDAVTMESIRDISDYILDTETLSIVAVGKIDSIDGLFMGL